MEKSRAACGVISDGALCSGAATAACVMSVAPKSVAIGEMPFMVCSSRGQFGARHFDKVMFNLPIPRFNPGNTLHLALAWGFVGIPLAWGVVQTLINAMKLFQ